MNPAFIDVIVLLIAFEFVGIFVFLMRRGRTDLLPAVLFFLLSGATLMIVIRFSLSDHIPSNTLLALLGVSFVMHILALFTAWRLIDRK
ncbi:MAG: hypothetical protein AAF950_03670 [Pseudomonadota bacterium]